VPPSEPAGAAPGRWRGRWRRHRWAGLALALVWLALALPLLLSGARTGAWDWDHVLAFADVERQAVVDFGVLPLWNPYVAGGTPLLQHPLSQVLCPDFLLALVFGIPFGLKLLAALRLALGLAGGYLLGLRLGMSRSGAVLAAAVMNASGAWAVHLAYGHFPWTLAGYLPWTLLALWQAQERRSWAWGSAAAAGIALLYLGGGPYLLFGLAFFAAAAVPVRALAEKRAAHLAFGLAPFLLAALLAGAKVLPSWELLRAHPRLTPPMAPLRGAAPRAGWLEVPLGLGRIYLARSSGEAIDPLILNHFAFWEAYRRGGVTRAQAARRNRLVEEINFHGYAGVLPLLLAAVALTLAPRRWLPWLAGLGVLWLLILGDAFARAWGFSPWQDLRTLPVLASLRTSGRFLVVAALPLGVLAGLGLTRLGEALPPSLPLLRRLVPPLLALAVAADLSLDAAPLLARAFPLPPVHPERRPFVTLRDPLGGSDLATERAGVGALLAHANLRLPSGVVPAGPPGYRGEAFLDGGHGRARLVEIRPNRAVVEVEAAAAELLVVNQTYLAGWRRAGRPAAVVDHGGRLATPVGLEDHRVVLTFRPATLPWGLAASALGLLLAGGAVAAERRRSRRSSPPPAPA
jgi:hypothetical protein